MNTLNLLSLTREDAIAELLKIVPPDTSFSLRHHYWCHRYSWSDSRTESWTWLLDVLRTDDGRGCEVLFHQEHTCLAWLVEQCRAHFEQASAQVEEASAK